MARKPFSGQWIAADWGTTNLRIWLIAEDGQVIAHQKSDQGMGKLRPDGFEPAFLDLAQEYLADNTQMPVIICGMAGAAEGWREAGYNAAPCAPISANMVPVATQDTRISVKIIPGIKQLSPADVMRGEETQIVGFLAQNPGFSGAICLPGTHTKWVEVADGAIRRFQTFMTGEIFNLLSKSSVLQHVIGAKGWDDTAFITGLNGSQKPTAQMFELRAAALLAGLSPIAARSQLSGHLIGAELGAVRPYWQDKKVVLIGDQALARAYQTALSHIGCHATIESGDTLVLAGLCAAMAMLEENGRGADHNS